MRKRFLLGITLIAAGWHMTAGAADLLEVYQQAQISDPIFQQAVAERLATKEGVPISASAILPNIALSAVPAVTRYGYSGSAFTPIAAPIPGLGFVNPRNLTVRSYNLTLSVTQTVFNFAQFSAVASQVALSKGADATLNAALQNLMIRVANAYFAVLRDEENLSYSISSKVAFQGQLDQMRQQYKVGLKTVTDVYTAQASYDTAVATYIGAQTTLANDRENLRMITGVYYPHLARLSDSFPLISPEPADIDLWVKRAILQNWNIKKTQYDLDSALQIIRQNFAGHLPTVNVQASATRLYADNINKYLSFINRNGPGTTSDRQIAMNINVPLFSGGGVVAQTNQASYSYAATQQQLEFVIRDTINKTRQSYLNVTAGVSKVTADRLAIKSSISSLRGLEASYRVGTETLVDVLNQQQGVYQQQTQYATDRYAFINNVLTLKQSAGTLGYNDLRAINAWLIEGERVQVARIHRRGRILEGAG